MVAQVGIETEPVIETGRAVESAREADWLVQVDDRCESKDLCSVDEYRIVCCFCALQLGHPHDRSRD